MKVFADGINACTVVAPKIRMPGQLPLNRIAVMIPLERPRWLDNIKLGIQQKGCEEVTWFEKAHDKIQRQTLAHCWFHLTMFSHLCRLGKHRCYQGSHYEDLLYCVILQCCVNDLRVPQGSIIKAFYDQFVWEVNYF